MSDEKLVPETLQTIGEKIAALGKRFDAVDKRFDAVDARFDAVDARFDAVDARFGAVDARFDAVDARFGTVDEQFAAQKSFNTTVGDRFDSLERRITTEIADVKAQLGVKIEAVHAEVKLVYDEVIAQRAKHKTNAQDHERFDADLTNHDLRLRALERKGGGESSV
jgi:tetrahydromethanopterin S-methyltransferase subunit G